MAKRGQRGSTPFSLSFLDIMSCGFGAVVLVFLITKHGIEESRAAVTEPLTTAVSQLERDLKSAEQAQAALTAQLAALEAEAQTLSPARASQQARLEAEQARLQALLEEAEASAAEAEKLAKAVETLQAEVDSQGRFGDDQQGSAARSIQGDGQRQYLTGLRVGGERILILFDRSASMLAEKIVAITTGRAIWSDVQKQAAPKWVRAKRTLEWLVSQLPLTSQFQIYHFSEGWEPALAGTEATWLPVNSQKLGDAAEASLALLPEGGTNLEAVFKAVKDLSPAPDNIILITDGLPTAGSVKTKYRVTGKDRVRLFEKATLELPAAIPLQVILLPLEGDPAAAPLFWRLSRNSGGSFMSPAEDWP